MHTEAEREWVSMGGTGSAFASVEAFVNYLLFFRPASQDFFAGDDDDDGMYERVVSNGAGDYGALSLLFHCRIHYREFVNDGVVQNVASYPFLASEVQFNAQGLFEWAGCQLDATTNGDIYSVQSDSGTGYNEYVFEPTSISAILLNEALYQQYVGACASECNRLTTEENFNCDSFRLYDTFSRMKCTFYENTNALYPNFANNPGDQSSDATVCDTVGIQFGFEKWGIPTGSLYTLNADEDDSYWDTGYFDKPWLRAGTYVRRYTGTFSPPPPPPSPPPPSPSPPPPTPSPPPPFPSPPPPAFSGYSRVCSNDNRDGTCNGDDFNNVGQHGWGGAGSGFHTSWGCGAPHTPVCDFWAGNLLHSWSGINSPETAKILCDTLGNDCGGFDCKHYDRFDDCRNSNLGQKCCRLKANNHNGFGALHGSKYYCMRKTGNTQSSCLAPTSSDYEIPNPFAAGATVNLSVPTAATVTYPLLDRRIPHLEVWVSQTYAQFGYRAGVIDTDDIGDDGRVLIRLKEGEGTFQRDVAEGRFVFLRAFTDDETTPLRIGSFRVYRSDPPARQLEEAVAPDDAAPEVPDAPDAPDADAPPPKRRATDAELQARLQTRMVVLTQQLCATSTARDHEGFHTVLAEAVLQWAELDTDRACWDCLLHRVGSCTTFFEYLAPPKTVLPKEHAESARRQLQDSLETHLDKACCRVHKKTRQEECSRSFCVATMAQHAPRRVAHTLRKLHEAPAAETSLSPVQLMATDMLSPKTAHPHAPCRKGALDAQSMECVTESILHHTLEKHGANRKEFDAQLSQVGLSTSKVLTSLMGIVPHAKTYSPPWRQTDDADAAVQRQAEGAALRAARRATRARRRLQEETPVRPPLRPTAASGTERAWQRGMHAWLNATAVHARDTHALHDWHTAPRHSHAADGTDRLRYTVDAAAKVFSHQNSLLGQTVAAGRALSDSLRRRPKVDWTASRMPPRPTTESAGAAHARRLYDHIDNLDAGRRLAEGPRGLELKESALPAWMRRLDWTFLVKEAHRVSRVLLQRTDATHAHVERTGTLPSGPLADEHRTGWGAIDVNVPPSVVGNQLRRFHGWIRGAPSVHAQAERARAAPRATESDHLDVARRALGGTHILDAVHEHLEATNAHHSSTGRRLAEGFLGAASAVPVTLATLRTRTVAYPEANTGQTFWEELLRFVVYDVVYAACVLTHASPHIIECPPPPTGSATCIRRARPAPWTTLATAPRSTSTTRSECASR